MPHYGAPLPARPLVLGSHAAAKINTVHRTALFSRDRRFRYRLGRRWANGAAVPHELDLHRVVVVGHSAGGHLAIWSAARSRLAADSPLHTRQPLQVRGALNLAGPVDMTANIDGYEGLCRDKVITALLGGTPTTVPERYAQASPIRLLPLGVPHVLVIGEHEDFVPRPLLEAYTAAASKAGDSVRLVVIPKADHFQIASPMDPSWPTVAALVRSLLDGTLVSPAR